MLASSEPKEGHLTCTAYTSNNLLGFGLHVNNSYPHCAGHVIDHKLAKLIRCCE